MTPLKTLPRTLIIALFIAWIVPGLVGRDLWKADEPYSFGLVNHIVNSGELVVPALAGEPFMEKPPLFYLTAAAFQKAFSPWMRPHDAARLATGFFMLLALLFTALTARELFGIGYGGIAAVILMGSTGLQLTAHKLITDVALLAGFSAALYGLALSGRRPVLGGLLLGTGTGIGFLSKGLLAPGIIGITAVALPAVFSSWRRKTYITTLIVACAASLPWLLIWPIALYRHSPYLFMQWLWYQNLGRFLGYAHVGRQFPWTFYFKSLPWFALPALPLALWALWKTRPSWRDETALQVPVTMFLVMFTVLTLSSSIRDLYALPMLLPLSLIAAAGAGTFSGSASKFLAWFSIVFFGLVSALLWLAWLALMTGHPASLAEQLLHFQPNYSPRFNGILFMLAMLYSSAWLFGAVRFFQAGYHSAIHWTSGMVLTWGLFMTILLPWLDSGSGYRTLFTSLGQAIPERGATIASQGVGESERAMLEYYAGILTRRLEACNSTEAADLLLIESGGNPPGLPGAEQWSLIWEGRRPSGDHPKEIFRLYEKKTAGTYGGRAPQRDFRHHAANRSSSAFSYPAD